MGVLLLKLDGLRTNTEIRDAINEELLPGPPLDQEAEIDLFDMVQYVEAGAGLTGQVSRLSRINYSLGLWELGTADITEEEARTMTGVTYTWEDPV